MCASFEQKVVAYVKKHTGMHTLELPSIRQVARALRTTQQSVYDAAESQGLCINVGVCCGGGVGEFELMGDYLLEDLS